MQLVHSTSSNNSPSENRVRHSDKDRALPVDSRLNDLDISPPEGSVAFADSLEKVEAVKLRLIE